MANLRNEFEFRSALLTALGQEHTEAEAKNEDTWRRKMLDGLGVEYNQNDVNQFGLFREKLIEGVTSKSEEGGGGSSDFSTAEVVVNSELGNIQYLNIVSVLDGQISALITNNFIMVMDSTVTYQVPLYKGLCIWSTTPGWNYNISVTGDITFEQGRIMIRGDGTITIS